MSLIYVHYVYLQLISYFFFNATATTEIYTLSLHDALPISGPFLRDPLLVCPAARLPLIFFFGQLQRSEEHTSELQSRRDLVCRLLLEKKKIQTTFIDLRIKTCRSRGN